MKCNKCGRKLKVVENYIDGQYFIKITCFNCGDITPMKCTTEDNAAHLKQSIIAEWELVKE